MAIVRLDVRFDALDSLVARANAGHVVVSLRDADTFVTLGSLHDRLAGPVGVWFVLSDDYSAQMAARDVATLSWLIALDTVVVSAASPASSAEVLEALLSDDEVNITNDVASIVAAYNRPAPPRPIAVWHWDGSVVRRGDEILREASTESFDGFDETTFR